MDYSKMTIQELEARNNELKEQEMLVKQERRKISHCMQEKIMQEDAVKKINQIGLEQAGKINQIITEAGGIESLAKMGTPGS